MADLAANLPRDSITMLTISPRQEIETWGVTDYLLAIIADHLAAANWQRSGKGRRPKPIQRPKVDKTRRVTVDRDAIDRFRAWYAEQPGGRALQSI